jgi:hypothetical protein
METAVRNALAIAIVANKRKCSQEAADLKAKVLKLEQDLQQQQQLNRLQAAKLCLQQEGQEGQTVEETHSHRTLRVPHLPVISSKVPADGPPLLHTYYQHLQHHMLTYTAAHASNNEAVMHKTLICKAAALSDMLLTNMQIASVLDSPDHLLPSHFSTTSSTTEIVSALSHFVLRTLIELPSSSLRTAYTQQCSTMLAALLSRPAEQLPHPRQHPSSVPLVQCHLRQPHQQHQQHQHPDEAVMALQLMRQLIACRSPAHGLIAAICSASEASSCSATSAQAAAQLLQFLLSFPSTALLQMVAVIQHLEQHVCQLQQTDKLFAGIQLQNLPVSMQLADEALDRAAAAFEESQQLLRELVGSGAVLPGHVLNGRPVPATIYTLNPVLSHLRCLGVKSVLPAIMLGVKPHLIQNHQANAPASFGKIYCGWVAPQEAAALNLPNWLSALSSCSWTSGAVSDLVDVVVSLYSAASVLQARQPLLTSGLCQLAAQLASSLQHIATAKNDQAARTAESDDALRSKCVGLCLKLRDLFMPKQA